MSILPINLPIGGRAMPDIFDLNQTRKVFRDFGLYDGDEDGPMVDAPLDKAIKTFQDLRGLKVDGIINPGGETENEIAKIKTGKPSPRYVQNQKQQNNVRENHIGFGGNPLGVLPQGKPKRKNETPLPTRKPEHNKKQEEQPKRNLLEMDVVKPTEKPTDIPVKQYNVKQKLLDIIGDVESNGNYNVIYGGEEKPLTQMTIKQIYDLQEKMIASGKKSTAVGKYQFISKTLKEVVEEQGIKENTLFDENVQDQLAHARLVKRGIGNFEYGDLPISNFIKKLSEEWASFPKDESDKSNYEGDGLNKSLIKYNEIKKLLEDSRIR